MVVAAALGASLAYALASVFQQHAASRAPASRALKMSLLTGLVARPIWLVGILADLAGFVLQFIALGHGSLVLVQPLLVCGLLFALPLEAVVARRRQPGWGEWLGSAAVCGGLALFLVVAHPDLGSSTTSATGWAIVSAGTAGPAFLLVAASRRAGGAARAGMQALAAGAVYGLAAAYTKTVAHQFSTGRGGLGQQVVHLAATWQTLALVAAGLIGLLLVQSAFQAGPLGWSLPALTVVDPVVSIVIGAVAFAEPISDSPAAVVLEGLGLLVMIVGVVGLTRSPLAPHPGDPAPPQTPPAAEEVGHR